MAPIVFDARRRAEQPAGELQPVAGGDGLQGGFGGDGPAARFPVDGLPFPGAGIDQLDGRRHRRALDRHRQHRPARADAQLAGDHAGQRNRVVRACCRRIRGSVIRWRR